MNFYTETLGKPQPQVAVQNPETGRWYVSMGRPGFNSPANNRNGYVSERSAINAARRYGWSGERFAIFAKAPGGERRYFADAANADEALALFLGREGNAYAGSDIARVERAL